jgi:hypothetical protein
MEYEPTRPYAMDRPANQVDKSATGEIPPFFRKACGDAPQAFLKKRLK